MAWAAVDPDGPYLGIGCAKSENQLCLEIPGCNQSKKDEIWRVPLSWPAYVSFRTTWQHQPIDLHPQLLSWAAERWAEVTERMAMRAAMDAMDPEVLTALVSLELVGGPQLDPLQRASAEWLIRWRRCILGDYMGKPGKTPPAIRSLQLLARSGEGLPALVIAPNNSLIAWARKLKTWAPELTVQLITGTATARRTALLADADVYLIGWENARLHTRLAAYQGQRFVCCPDEDGVHPPFKGVDPKITVNRCEVHPKELNTHPDGRARRWATVIADECHRMKDPKSKQSRAVQWLAHHAENFWALTGTLTADTVGDLWPVLHAIDPKAWPARSRYLDLWAVLANDWYGREYLDLRPENAAAFHDAVDPCFRRVIAEGITPGRGEPEFIYPELVPAQARAYREIQRDMLADLDGQTLVPDNDGVKFNRLVQLASSMVELADGEDKYGFTRQDVRLKLPSNKAEALVDFLGDQEGQWIVSCYAPDLMDLCARKLDEAKIVHTRIVGGMGPVRADEAAQLFQNSPEVRVIFVNSAGAESIDLYAACGVIFLQPYPSHIMTTQIIGRADRRGQTRLVRVVYMISPGTVDSRLFELSCEKDERHQSVTRDAEMMRWMITEGELAGT